MPISVIKKRDGRISHFDVQKITNAINKSFLASDSEKDYEELSTSLALEVYTLLELEGNPAPGVEHVQDLVEQVLMREGYVQTAKNYILYRQERNRARELYEHRLSEEPLSSEVEEPPVLDKALQNLNGCSQLTLPQLLCRFDAEQLDSVMAYACLSSAELRYHPLALHRGLCVYALDTGMAPGVAKTYTALYFSNLSKALELFLEHPLAAATLKSCKDGAAQQGLYPSMEGAEVYQKREADLLCGTLGLERETVVRSQAFAAHHALTDTQRAVSHAVELLLLTLDTAQSAPGIATPYLCLSYGLDTTPEGREVTRGILQTTHGGVGSAEPSIFPVQVFCARKGVSLQPEDPNYDLYQLAQKCAAKRLFPQILPN